jgi:NAD(P)-dependent dehydrogenase (short-subunit alcohol dehydrogenase family)
MDLTGKTVLVTGGAVRIGRRICERLAEAGADVVIHCHRSGVEARELAGRLQQMGRSAWVVQEDLDSEAGCEAVIREAVALAGKLDGLVNNASVFHKRDLADTDLTHLMQELRPNLIAPLLLIRAFSRVSKVGRIVNLLDRRVATLEKGALAYQLSKRALADLTRLAALELAPAFTVNGVAPGPVLPPREGGGISDKAGRILTRDRPSPDAVAEAVLFLLRADSITGQILFVDGGQHLMGG